MSGTDVTKVDIDLAATPGGTTGDAQVDTVNANGTNGNDIVDIFGSGTSLAVIGPSAQVNVTNLEGANDALVIIRSGATTSFRLQPCRQVSLS
jgi:hypothetical protein